MARYAVIGKPIQHSKSPLIHGLFAQQTGEDVLYEAIEVESDALEEFVVDFFASGGAGLNVTLPYKERVFALARSRSARASQAQAANTLLLDAAGALCADNTDGVGLVRDLQDNNGFRIAGKRVLLLGAGGAARGALGALIAAQPSALVIANRTLSKAQQLQMEFAALQPIEVRDYMAISADTALGDAPFDLIVNATSMGIQDGMPPLAPALLAPSCCCYDMMYKSGDTAFVRWAKANDVALALDGIGMLVEQAAEAFQLWRGVRPATRPVIDRLRNQI